MHNAVRFQHLRRATEHQAKKAPKSTPKSRPRRPPRPRIPPVSALSGHQQTRTQHRRQADNCWRYPSSRRWSSGSVRITRRYLLGAHPAIQQVVKYMDQQWIANERIPIALWCQYGRDVRTNNAIEGWHHRSKRRVNTHLDDPRVIAQGKRALGGPLCPDRCRCEGTRRKSCIRNHQHPRSATGSWSECRWGIKFRISFRRRPIVALVKLCLIFFYWMMTILGLSRSIRSRIYLNKRDLFVCLFVTELLTRRAIFDVPGRVALAA